MEAEPSRFRAVLRYKWMVIFPVLTTWAIWADQRVNISFHSYKLSRKFECTLES